MEEMKHSTISCHTAQSVFPHLQGSGFKLKHEQERVKITQLKTETEDPKELGSEESYDLEPESLICESEFLEVKLVEDKGSITLPDLEMRDQMTDAAKIFSLSQELENLNKFRKRKINMDEWKDIKRKKLRDAGKAHISRRGTLVEEKRPSNQARVCKIECCTREGCAKLTLEEKLELFDEYYKLTYDEQSTYLLKRLAVLHPKRRKKGKDDTTSRRKCSFKYYITVKQKELEVCQKTLLDTFSITQRRVQTIQMKAKSGVEKPVDMRGKHKNRPHAIPEDIKDTIREHISGFLNQPIGYFAKKSDFSVQKMYVVYKECYPDTRVSRHLFEDVFRNDFKLRFICPQITDIGYTVPC